MLRRKTKIVATLGPACNDVQTMKELINAGIDTARINFSHGTYESLSELINTLKAARGELNAPVALMLDTKGPEIRIKTFKENKVFLEQGKEFRLTTRDIEGDATQVSITYEDLPKDVNVGSRILIDDGLIEMKVVAVNDTDIDCIIVNSGFLSSRKGVNVPDVYVNLPSITEKDEEDIKFGIEMGFDYIAASFVRSAKDVLEIRRVLEENNGTHIHIIAKIENRDGVNNLESILEVADGIMVARGDLGVEIPPEEVPLVQKQLIKRANFAGKPVITATQMLESMVNNPRPTRAEANDVANAIFDGSDAIMLSGETASGKHPVEAVRMMARIALKTESSIDYMKKIYTHHPENTSSITNAVSYATCTTASDLNAACIVTVTNSGFTPRMIARYKPACPILAVALSEVRWRQMNLVWGCYPTLFVDGVDDINLYEIASQKAQETQFAATGDLIVITAGVPVGVSGSTNTMKVQVVGNVLVKGRGRGNGTVSGRACVVKVSEESDKFFNNGDILVTTSTDDSMMDYIRKAGALVVGSDQSVDTSHAETACNALCIPIIICKEKVIELIPNDVPITIDAEKGFVYNGLVE